MDTEAGGHIGALTHMIGGHIVVSTLMTTIASPHLLTSSSSCSPRVLLRSSFSPPPPPLPPPPPPILLHSSSSSSSSSSFPCLPLLLPSWRGEHQPSGSSHAFTYSLMGGESAGSASRCTNQGRHRATSALTCGRLVIILAMHNNTLYPNPRSPEIGRRWRDRRRQGCR
jgi:hypothetical protein